MTEIDPSRALEYVGTTVGLISVGAGDRRNVMTATRLALLAPKPVLVAVSVAKRRYSHDLISEAGEFVVAIASTEQTQLAANVGKYSGRDGDKFARYGVDSLPATKVKSPLIAGAACNMECKLVDKFTAGDFTVFVGEVLALHVNEDAMPLLRYRGKYMELGREL